MRFFVLVTGRYFSCRGHLTIDPVRPDLAAGVGAEAAPFPLIGFRHQPTLQGIALHVAQLLDSLARTRHIGIVETLPPDRRQRSVRLRGTSPAAEVPNQRRFCAGWGDLQPATLLMSAAPEGARGNTTP
jgi:hypothetical protein